MWPLDALKNVPTNLPYQIFNDTLYTSLQKKLQDRTGTAKLKSYQEQLS